MAEIYKIGTLAELKAKSPVRAKLGGQDIAVFALGEDIVAINGHCPHAGGPLFRGEVAGCEITCPWHGWIYNLKSGACQEDPELFLERYEVRVEAGEIFVVI